MKLRDRIQKFKRIPAKELRPNPKNFRTHPETQRQALRGLLQEIGFAGAQLVYKSERAGGALVLIDGQMRLEEVDPDFPVPCLLTDLDDAEADKLLAAFDALSDLAESDPAKLQALISEIETESAALAKMFDDLAAAGVEIPAEGETELKTLDPKPPPKMTWVLIGIPTVRFGEINQYVEALAEFPEVICETTCNDG